jgi:hypothetical protein
LLDIRYRIADLLQFSTMLLAVLPAIWREKEITGSRRKNRNLDKMAAYR